MVSYSLESEYQELLKKIAEQNRRTMTEEVRIMIDHRALAMGLEPVRKEKSKATDGT